MFSKKFRVLIPDHIDNPSLERKVLGNFADVVVLKAKITSDVPDNEWPKCDAVIAYDNIKYSKEIIDKMVKCKIIVRAGIGYDNIDLDSARKKKIVVCNVPDYCIEEVADHTIAFLLALVRGFPEHVQQVIKRDWKRTNDITFRLRNKVFGIVGLGRIGKATLVRAKALGLKVIYFDPYIEEGIGNVLGVKRVNSLSALAKEADIVSIHTPLTEETENMIDAKFFSSVKPGVFLINTARGSIIDLSALKDAMKSGKVKACALDVLPVEPSDDTQELIVSYEKGEEWIKNRLIVTPHTAYFSKEALDDVRVKSAEEVKRAFNGEKIRNKVN